MPLGVGGNASNQTTQCAVPVECRVLTPRDGGVEKYVAPVGSHPSVVVVVVVEYLNEREGEVGPYRDCVAGAERSSARGPKVCRSGAGLLLLLVEGNTGFLPEEYLTVATSMSRDLVVVEEVSAEKVDVEV